MPDAGGDHSRTLWVTLDDTTSALAVVEREYLDRRIAQACRPAS
jgi:hypothetical protein